VAGTITLTVDGGTALTPLSLSIEAGALTLAGQGVGVSVSGDWQLASGHFMPAKKSLVVVYPRPNTETETYARQRKAYYDGSNSIEYRVPVGVQFGAWPYHFEVTSGPSGMTVGAQYGDSNYGVVTWTPSGPASGTSVAVRVTDQESNYVDVTWTVTTSSSTSDFIFVSTSGNDSTGDGTIGSPFATLSKVMGATESSGAYPGRICYFRAGTYNVPTQGQINPSYQPMSFLNYPGESVTFNCATARQNLAFGTNAGTNDFMMQGITLDGANSTATNYRTFWAGGVSHRWCIDQVAITDPYNGSVGGDVTTGFFFDSPGTGVYRTYIYFNECTESGRSGSGGNAYSLLATYVCRYVLIERCTVSSGATQDIYLKASTRDATVRANSITNSGASGTGAALATGCQVDSGLANQDFEYCYNTIDAPDYGALTFNYGYFSPGQHWAYRNSIRGRIWLRADGAGPYTLEQNAIENDTTDGGGNAQVSTQGSPTYTNTGTECQAASGVFDSGLLLTGTYRTNYLGTRGAEIA
jgi:hypothetical protein